MRAAAVAFPPGAGNPPGLFRVGKPPPLALGDDTLGAQDGPRVDAAPKEVVHQRVRKVGAPEQDARLDETGGDALESQILGLERAHHMSEARTDGVARFEQRGGNEWEKTAYWCAEAAWTQSSEASTSSRRHILVSRCGAMAPRATRPSW